MNRKIWIMPFLLFTFSLIVSHNKGNYSNNKSNFFFKHSIYKIKTKGYYYRASNGIPQYDLEDAIHNKIIDTADMYCDFLFFYEDSTIFIFSTVLKHFDSIQSVISNEYFKPSKKNIFKNLGRWGFYSIDSNNISAIVFRHNPVRPNSLLKEELKINVENSDTLLLLKAICKKCKNKISDYVDKTQIEFSPPEKFTFVRFENKPDSNVILPLKKRMKEYR